MAISPTLTNPLPDVPGNPSLDDSIETPRLVRTHTLGIRADVANIETILSMLDKTGLTAARQTFLATFVNPSSVTLASRNNDYRLSLSRFDLVAPDGFGMCLAIRWLHGFRTQRISFDNTSLAPVVFDFAIRRGLSVALVGAKPGVAEQAAKRIREHFPDLRIVAALDGYGDFDEKIRRINGLSADIVICGMGGSMQENFLLRLSDSQWSGYGFTCGGFLDQLLDGYIYYPLWVNSMGLRWAYRLLKEPRRLWRRYLIEYPQFGVRLCHALASGASAGEFRRPG
jgi:N-acetylglucosaminyldiphosphoundecaprenol N-acetyl-beta-D-mannosaminyltransferase